MNTHIVIPIKDIEKLAKILKQQIEILKNENSFALLIDAQAKYILYGELLSCYKQISLDEKDIEEKAKGIAMKVFGGTIESMCEKSYKQALKDLLRQ